MSKYGYGRDAAIKHRWIQLKTKPADYRPVFGKLSTDLSHCELCGMAVSYTFPLAHKSDPHFRKGKSLWIGQDCVKNYFLHNLPMTIIEEMISNMTQLVEEEKRSKFKLKYPRFPSMLNSVQEQVNELKRQYSGCYDVLSGKRRIKDLIVLDKAVTEYAYNGYVSESRVLSVKAIRLMIKQAELEKKLKSHWSLKLKKIRISSDQKTNVNKEFYNKFIENAYELGWAGRPDVSSPALSELEKQAFSEQLELLTQKKAKGRDNVIVSE